MYTRRKKKNLSPFSFGKRTVQRTLVSNNIICRSRRIKRLSDRSTRKKENRILDPIEKQSLKTRTRFSSIRHDFGCYQNIQSLIYYTYRDASDRVECVRMRVLKHSVPSESNAIKAGEPHAVNTCKNGGLRRFRGTIISSVPSIDRSSGCFNRYLHAS